MDNANEAQCVPIDVKNKIKCHSLYFIFDIKWYTLSFICIIHKYFYKIIWKNRFFKISFLYNFVDYPSLSCMYFTSILKCVYIFNTNVNYIMTCLCFSFFLKDKQEWIHHHLLLQLLPNCHS